MSATQGLKASFFSPPWPYPYRPRRHAVLPLEICFLIAGSGGGICFAFSCETELSWCRCSRHSLSQGTWARQFWGEAFSITWMCIPGGTNDKRGLILCSKPSFLQSLSCFEEQNIHSYTWVSTTASTRKQKDASGIPPQVTNLELFSMFLLKTYGSVSVPKYWIWSGSMNLLYPGWHHLITMTA